MLAIRLPADIEERLAALATRTGRSKSWYVRNAILTHLDTLESQYLNADGDSPSIKEAGSNDAYRSGTPESEVALQLASEELSWLQREAQAQHISTTELIRQALDTWRAQQHTMSQTALEETLNRTSGIWPHGDSVAWQRALRDEWQNGS